ncbi:hydrophobin family protein [Aspergillus affinis]|uniref:hydrophobin family protein n=1 Tax=Aspergillus affinis TaxID=1070780 RepID=UPI0022FF031C|nr:uncharacterized protein KD926_009263 [Aspergillus affinis]KAI9039538.1 hypothetical protein KD926_009263 [Aspergillus affinis]
MKFFAVAALFAATALALPETGPKVGNAAQELYGKCSNGKRSCCNSDPTSAKLNAEQHANLLGLLDGPLIPGLNSGEYSGCSDLLNLIPGQCQGSIACCDDNSVNSGVNVVLPCLAVPVGV